MKRGGARVRLVRSLLPHLTFASSCKAIGLCVLSSCVQYSFSPWSYYTACHYHSEPPDGTSFLLKPNLAFQKDWRKLNWC